MPTGIGNGIAGDVFQNNLGAGGGGGLVCPSRYSWQGDGVGVGGSWGLMGTGPYNLGATNSSASIWYKPIDIRGATDLGAGLYSTDAGGPSFTSGTNIYTSPSGVLTASLGPMIFPAHPELVTNGSFTEVPVGAELIANPTFSDAASITPWNTTGAPNATLTWNARFMRMTYTVANGVALFDNMGQTLNTMYSVKMRVRGVTSAGADQGSAFDAIGDNSALTSANIISNPTLTSEYQDYEFRVWSTDVTFRFYLATAAIGDVVDFDSISVKPITANISNGNFGTGDLTGWSAGSTDDGVTPTAVAAGTGYAAKISNGPLAGNSYISQAAGIVEGKSYKITYRIVSNSSPGTHELNFENYGTVVSTVGTHEFYIVGLLGATGVTVKRNPSQANVDIEVTDLSIEELGEGWTLGSGWTFGDSVAICDGSSANDLFYQNTLPSGDDKLFKVTFTISSYTSGIVYPLFLVNGSAIPRSAVGTYTIYGVRQYSNNYIYLRGVNFIGEVSNYSVSEVLSEDEWHHLAVSIDRDSEWKWYVDGVLTNTMDNSTDQAPSIGLSSLGLTNVSTSIPSFYGNMTEPSLWNIPLSSSEVKDIYDNMYGGQRCLDILPFSSDLITNGKFNQIGPELIINGDFSATINITIANYNFATGDMTGWNTSSSGDGVTPYYSDGGALISNGATGGQSAITQTSILEDAKSYKISYRIVSNDGGGLNLNGYGVFDSTVGSHSFYIVGLAAYTTLNIKRSGSNVNIVITDIVVEELGADWTVQEPTGQSVVFSNNQLHVTYDAAATQGSTGVNQLALDFSTSYKITIDVAEVSGQFKVQVGQNSQTINSVGIQTFYKTTVSGAGGDRLYIVRLSNAISTEFKINSISVQEVGQGWTVITTTGGTVTFPEGMARIQVDATVGNNAYISQPGVMEIGKSYTMTYRIVSNNGGSLYTSSGVTNPALPSTVGSHEITFISDNTTLNIARAVDNTDVSITNVTLTQVGSGNLERWWRMNGTEPLLITLPNVAPNGIVNDVVPQNDPLVQPDTP
jgi:hypothetical protein